MGLPWGSFSTLMPFLRAGCGRSATQRFLTAHLDTAERLLETPDQLKTADLEAAFNPLRNVTDPQVQEHWTRCRRLLAGLHRDGRTDEIPARLRAEIAAIRGRITEEGQAPLLSRNGYRTMLRWWADGDAQDGYGMQNLLATVRANVDATDRTTVAPDPRAIDALLDHLNHLDTFPDFLSLASLSSLLRLARRVGFAGELLAPFERIAGAGLTLLTKLNDHRQARGLEAQSRSLATRGTAIVQQLDELTGDGVIAEVTRLRLIAEGLVVLRDIDALLQTGLLTLRRDLAPTESLEDLGPEGAMLTLRGRLAALLADQRAARSPSLAQRSEPSAHQGSVGRALAALDQVDDAVVTGELTAIRARLVTLAESQPTEPRSFSLDELAALDRQLELLRRALVTLAPANDSGSIPAWLTRSLGRTGTLLTRFYTFFTQDGHVNTFVATLRTAILELHREPYEAARAERLAESPQAARRNPTIQHRLYQAVRPEQLQDTGLAGLHVWGAAKSAAIRDDVSAAVRALRNGPELCRLAGPLAAAIAGRGMDWQALFGFEIDPTTDEIWPNILVNGDHVTDCHISQVILCRNGQPRATLMVHWRDDGDGNIVPDIYRVTVEENGTEIICRQTLLNLAGEAQPILFEPIVMNAGGIDGRVNFVTATLLGRGALQIGIGQVNGRRSLMVQDSDDNVLLIARHRYAEDDHLRAVHALEDSATILSRLPAAFAVFVRTTMARAIARLARRDPDDPRRLFLLERVAHSRAAFWNFLLHLSRGEGLEQIPERDRPATQLLAARLLIDRKYGRSTTIEDVQVDMDQGLTVAVAQENNGPGARRLNIVQQDMMPDHTDPKEVLQNTARALHARVGNGSWTHNDDGVLEVALSASVVARLSGLSEPMEQGALEGFVAGLVNEALQEAPLDEVIPHVWCVTVELRGENGATPQLINFRNKARYEVEWPERGLGYHARLDGEGPFCWDAVLGNNHPMWASLIGLGQRSVESLDRLGDHNGQVLLLHDDFGPGVLGQHLLVTGRLSSRELGDDLESGMGVLDTQHRELVAELRSQLEQTPRPADRPTWNQISWQLGRLRTTPADFESAIQNLAAGWHACHEGLRMKGAHLRATLQDPESGNTIEAVVTVRDTFEFPVVECFYRVHCLVGESETASEVSVKRVTLESLLAGRQKVRPDECVGTEVVFGSIRDISAAERKSSAAKLKGTTWIYDRVFTLTPLALGQMWRDAGKTPPKDLVMSVEEIVPGDDGVQTVLRPNGHAGDNPFGAAAFVVTMRTPTHPEGRKVMMFGSDRTHPDARLGAQSKASGMFMAAAVERATAEGIDILYIGETSGAKMGLPLALIPRKGDNCKVFLDESGGTDRLYLTTATMRAYLQETKAIVGDDDMTAAIAERFIGEWDGDRFYFTDILRDGVNSESLAGSGAVFGAIARAARLVRTVSVVIGRGLPIVGERFKLDRKDEAVDCVGIGGYIDAVCEGRGQRKGSAKYLAGPTAVYGMFKQWLFRTKNQLGGWLRNMTGGATNFAFESEAEGLRLAITRLDSQDPVELSYIGAARVDPEMPIGIERTPGWQRQTDSFDAVMEQARAAASDEFNTARSVVQDAGGGYIPTMSPMVKNPYSVKAELEALVDPGSVRWLETKSPQAAIGYGTVNGYTVALVGCDMRQFTKIDADGQAVTVPVTSYDETGIPTTRDATDSMIGGTMDPSTPVEIAAFLAAQPRHRMVVGDLSQKGYRPDTVSESFRGGAWLASELAHLDAPTMLYMGPDRTVLGGMHVTIAPELHRHGRLELYAHETANNAVLATSGWDGIGFVRSTEKNLTRIFGQTWGPRAGEVARKVVFKVIDTIGTIRRSESVGSINGVVSGDEFRGLVAERAEAWYSGAECQALHTSFTQSSSSSA